jgi:sugar phosphate isomerase/epimerase
MFNFCTTYNYGMCLDLCHARLYCNYNDKNYLEYMKKVKPIVRHLHFSDCVGIDSEGLQIGEGEINWDEICEVFSDHKYGWTPEIWNGHYDHGERFFEAHRRLNRKFMEFGQRRNSGKNEIR